MQANVACSGRIVAFANARQSCGERFQFRAAHSENSLCLLAFTGECRLDCGNGRGAETGIVDCGFHGILENAD